MPKSWRGQGQYESLQDSVFEKEEGAGEGRAKRRGKPVADTIAAACR